VWLAERGEGEPYREEIDAVLQRIGITRNTEHDVESRAWRRSMPTG
jgi:hypothetical protein